MAPFSPLVPSHCDISFCTDAASKAQQMVSTETNLDQTEVHPHSIFHSIDMQNEEDEIIAQDIALLDQRTNR